MNIFSYRGALSPDSLVFSGRETELEMLLNLAHSPIDAYAIIFGGQRLGKTSLLYRLKKRLSPHIGFVLVNFAPINGSDISDIYRHLAEELIGQLGINSEMKLQDVNNGSRFRTFLRKLEPPVVTIVALEDLKGLSEDALLELAQTLRSIHQDRYLTNNSTFSHFLFILTGGIELYQPVSGSPVSPLYNISEKIYLSDLTTNESRELLKCGLSHEQLSEDEIFLICDTIYEQVHGHPYLTQRLGAYIAEYIRYHQAIPSPDLLCRNATDFVNNDEKFLSMFNSAEKENLIETLRDIAAKTRKYRFMRGNGKVTRLEIIGFIREENGGCVIRNQVFLQRLQDIFRMSSLPNHSSLSIQNSDSAPPPIQARRIPFILQLAQKDEKTFEVRVTESPGGQTSSITSLLPYTTTELAIVLKALQPLIIAQYPFRQEQIDILRNLDLWDMSGIISELPKRIGKCLYDTLMVGDVSTRFAVALAKGLEENRTIALQLRFDERDVELARYPWELLHDGMRKLLPSRMVEMTRYISYPEPVIVPPPVIPPLRLLYIRSRPANLNELSTEEQYEVQQTLQELKAEKILEIDILDEPTYDGLLDYLDRKAVHALHFDGHGIFARQCPKCGKMNAVHFLRCQNELSGVICDRDISTVSPQGYLAFEHKDHHTHWINSETLNDLLSGRQIRLAVLSACRSGTIDGETLFNGTASALILARVPAVVSIQLPISLQGAVKFTKGFYRAISLTNSIPAAVNRGRLGLIESEEWFIPVLYARTDDEKLSMFTTTEERN